MKNKQLLIAIVVLVVLGAAVDFHKGRFREIFIQWRIKPSQPTR